MNINDVTGQIALNSQDGPDPSRNTHRQINISHADDANLREELAPIIQRALNLRINEFEQEIAERARIELEQGLLDSTQAARNAAEVLLNQGI